MIFYNFVAIIKEKNCNVHRPLKQVNNCLCNLQFAASKYVHTELFRTISGFFNKCLRCKTIFLIFSLIAFILGSSLQL